MSLFTSFFIRRQRWASNKAIVARDFAGLAETLSNDIHMTTGDGGKLMGIDQVMGAYEAQLRGDPSLILKRSAHHIHVSKNGLAAFEMGEWSASNHAMILSKGLYGAAWRREGEVWRAHAEVYVSLR